MRNQYVIKAQFSVQTAGNILNWGIFKTLVILAFVISVSLPAHAQFENERRLYSPNGIFDNIFDKDGNAYQLNDLKIDQTLETSRSSQSNCINSGYFVLHYDVGSGLEDLTNPDHIARRNVFCQLFEDISQFVIPSNPANEVHIWVRNFNDPNLNAPSNALALATSFYATPYTISPGDVDPVRGIVDGLVWQTINSGLDAYSNLVPPVMTYSQTTNSLFYHGMMAFNFDFPWHTDLSTLATEGTYDLYSVALHEVTHALGFNSMITDSGTSTLGSNRYYSRFDTFLKSPTGLPLLVHDNDCSLYNTSWNTQMWPPDITTPVNSEQSDCEADNTVCEHAIIYNGSTTQPVFTPNCFLGGSSLSHFEDLCHLPSAEPNNQYYVMSNANGTGPLYTKRFLKPEERLVLCDLGYSVASSYGDPSNLNFHDYASSICNENEQIAGINDGLNSDGTFTWVTSPETPITISGAAILANDYGESAALGFSCVQVIIGGGIVSLSQGNNSTNFTYSPPANSSGVHLLRYVPVDGTRLGNITYIFVYVVSANCAPLSCNELINNGGFEIAPGECSWGFDGNPLSCWSTYTQSPDLYSRNCLITNAAGSMSNFLNIPVSYQGGLDTWDAATNPDNNHFVRMGGMIQPEIQSEESMQTFLTSPLIPGNFYTIRLRAISVLGVMPKLIACATEMPLALAPVSSYPTPNLIQLGTPITIEPDYQWHFIEMTFQ